jgi:hypothetical protein
MNHDHHRRHHRWNFCYCGLLATWITTISYGQETSSSLQLILMMLSFCLVHSIFKQLLNLFYFLSIFYTVLLDTLHHGSSRRDFILFRDKYVSVHRPSIFELFFCLFCQILLSIFSPSETKSC